MEETLQHGLDRQDAKKALQSAFDEYRERFDKYNPWAEWGDEYIVEFGFSAKGVTVEGRAEVLDDRLEVELDVPFLLRMFKGKAMDVIRDELDKWTERAESGDL